MESPNSIPWTWSQKSTAADTAEVDAAVNLLSQCGGLWDFLNDSLNSSQTQNEPPAKKIKLEEFSLSNSNIEDVKSVPSPTSSNNESFQALDDLLSTFTHTQNEPPAKNIELDESQASSPNIEDVNSVPIPSPSDNDALDDLLAPFTPTLANENSYLQTLSDLEKVLNIPNSGKSIIKEEPMSPSQFEPVDTFAPVKSEPIEREVSSPATRDLLAFAMDSIGFDVNEVDAIPDSPDAQSSPSPVSNMSPPYMSPTMQHVTAPTNMMHYVKQVKPVTRSQPMMRSNIPQQAYSIHKPSTRTTIPAQKPISRKRDRDLSMAFPQHPQMFRMPPQHLPPWLNHPSQQQFPHPQMLRLPPQHLQQQPIQQRIRIYPCPKCRRGFRAPEQRSAHVASGECTRVQRSVRLLPEGRGWQCILCNQHIQRRDVKMHLRAHNRGEIPGNMNNV